MLLFPFPQICFCFLLSLSPPFAISSPNLMSILLNFTPRSCCFGIRFIQLVFYDRKLHGGEINAGRGIVSKQIKSKLHKNQVNKKIEQQRQGDMQFSMNKIHQLLSSPSISFVLAKFSHSFSMSKL